MTNNDHKDDDDEEQEDKLFLTNNVKAKLPNLNDWDEIFKKLGQKSYKEIWGKPKK